MHDFFSQAWDMLMGRTTGPMAPRFILQPTMAVIFAIRAGLKDAREGQAPFLWSFATEPGQRAALLRQAWKNVRNVFFIALGLDVVYEVMVFKRVFPLQVVVVAVALAIVPYVIVRGIVTRIARKSTPRSSPPPSRSTKPTGS